MATTFGTMAFTVTAGSAGAVTIVNAGATGIPNGNYQFDMKLDETGWTIAVLTPVGVVQQSGVMHSGSD